MSIILSVEYPNGAETGDAGYPQGKVVNSLQSGDGLGLPYDKKWLNDLMGFLQDILDKGGITPSEVPDQVDSSDYLKGLFAASGRAFPNLAAAAIAKEVQIGTSCVVYDVNDGVYFFKAVASGTGTDDAGETFLDCSGSAIQWERIYINNVYTIEEVDSLFDAVQVTTDAIEEDVGTLQADVAALVEEVALKATQAAVDAINTAIAPLLGAITIDETDGSVNVSSGLLTVGGSEIGGIEQLIADDSVVSFTPPRVGGFMLISSPGDDTYPQAQYSGLLWFDSGPSTNIVLADTSVWVGSTSVMSAYIDVVKGVALDGTTGSDGNLTISVQEGSLLIENRTGGDKIINITWL